MKEHGKNWSVIAEKIGNGITGKQCRDKSYDLTSRMKKDQCPKDEAFTEAVYSDTAYRQIMWNQDNI